jgi:broad specificity phosphatase PhoE
MSQEHRALYLMRHAEVETAYHRTFGGRIDMDISDLGVSQAKDLADYLRRHPFDSCFASPMKRVIKTAAPHTEWTQASPTHLDGLREVDFGDWTGLKWEEVHEKHNQSAFDWLHLLEQNAITNAEPIEAFSGRVESALNRILAEENGSHIGVFCHGGVIRMLLALILKLPVFQMSSFEFNYASVTVIHMKASRPEVQLSNYCPWQHHK